LQQQEGLLPEKQRFVVKIDLVENSPRHSVCLQKKAETGGREFKVD
jgi:hypothetical protein